MAKKLIYLPEPNEETKRRMIEVKFYILINSISEGGQQSMETNILLEALASKMGVSKTLISVSSFEICSPRYRPTKNEIVATLAHINAPIRKIYKLTGITSITYYKYLQEYIKNGAQLYSQFDNSRHKVLETFVNRFVGMLQLPMEVLSSES